MMYAKRESLIRKFRFTVMVMILFSVCMQTFAEQNDPNKQEDLFEMSLEELMDVEVVSVSRRERKISQSSAQVTVITAEDIHHSGLTNIPEILRLAPGLDVQRLDRNRYAVSVRGFQGIYSDRILVLINGRSAGNPVLAGINWESFPVLMEDIERIEIVRGPGGAAWGANAENGVVNIITKKPADTEGTFVSTTFNEYGDSYTHTRFSKISDIWSWRLSAGYEDLEGSDDAGAGKYAVDGLPAYPGYEAGDFARNWRFDFQAHRQYSDDTELSVGVAHSNLEMGGYEFAAYYPMKDVRTNYTRLFTRLDHTFDDGSTGYIQWSGNYYVSHAPSLVKRYSFLENDVEMQYNLAPVNGHEISLGGNVRAIHMNTTSGPAPEIQFEDEPYDEYWAGFFISDRFELTDRLMIENQVRADWYSETDFDWSLRSSAIYSLDEAKDHVLRFSFARAFRSPAVGLRKTSASYLGGAFNAVQPTKDLVNEEIWSLEAGYNGSLGDGVNLSLNGYYQKYDNILAADMQIAAGPVINYIFANTGGADAYGAEVELALTRKTHRTSAWYTYNALQTDDFNQETRAGYPARHKAGLHTTLLLSDDLVFNANYTYYDSIHHYGGLIGVDTPLSHRLDLNLSKKFSDGKGEIMIGVSDVLNETSGPVFGIAEFVAHETPGRTFFARLQMNF